jgi:hypothetical protein
MGNKTEPGASGKSAGGILSFLGHALEAGTAVVTAIMKDREEGNTNTLDALEKIIPDEAVIRARNEAVKAQEREEFLRELEKKGG